MAQVSNPYIINSATKNYTASATVNSSNFNQALSKGTITFIAPSNEILVTVYSVWTGGAAEYAWCVITNQSNNKSWLDIRGGSSAMINTSFKVLVTKGKSHTLKINGSNILPTSSIRYPIPSDATIDFTITDY